MKKQVLLAALLTSALSAPVMAADDASALAQMKNCMGCHQIDNKVVGPSYKDVAKKYADDDKAVEKLVAKVKAGGAGVWGQIPMPPNNVTDEEAKKLVEWILDMK